MRVGREHLVLEPARVTRVDEVADEVADGDVTDHCTLLTDVAALRQLVGAHAGDLHGDHGLEVTRDIVDEVALPPRGTEVDDDAGAFDVLHEIQRVPDRVDVGEFAGDGVQRFEHRADPRSRQALADLSERVDDLPVGGLDAPVVERAGDEEHCRRAELRGGRCGPGDPVEVRHLRAEAHHSWIDVAGHRQPRAVEQPRRFGETDAAEVIGVRTDPRCAGSQCSLDVEANVPETQDVLAHREAVSRSVSIGHDGHTTHRSVGRITYRPMRSVDCDTHFFEPIDLWREHSDPAWRDSAPRLVVDGDRLLLCVDEVAYPASSAHAGLGSIYRADGTVTDSAWDLHVASIDPVQRLGRMDRTGTDVEIVYPTVAMMGMHSIRDPLHAASHARAYNRFAASVTAESPDRLRAAMIVPLNHPTRAVAELVHAREQLGLGVLLVSFTAPAPYTLSSPELDIVWAAARDLDVTVTFQDSSIAAGERTTGLARATTWRMLYLASHVVEAQLGLADLLLGGTIGRVAGLRIGIQETHVRWLPSWLTLLDERFGRRRGATPLPSESFRDHCFVAAFPDEPGVREFVDAVGPDNLVFSSDWPHRELVAGTDPQWVAAVSGRTDLRREEIDRALDANARRWFGLDQVS